jgi:hypothetical protein
MSIARISCTLLRPSSTCAAFIKESRMKYISATKLHRKCGIREQSFAPSLPSRCFSRFIISCCQSSDV